MPFDLGQHSSAANIIEFANSGGGVGLQMHLGEQDNWQPISTAPYWCDLELAVIGRDGVHALFFPCRRSVGGWLKAQTLQRIDIRPTHWRLWRVKA